MGSEKELLSVLHFQNIGLYILELSISFILGWLLGLLRGSKQPVAGVRTHMVVACASCLISACGADLVGTATGTGDATRLAGQILAGIGFIGAGAIISRGVGVMTTATTIFFAAGVGIACGVGFIGFAIVSTILVAAGLTVAERLFPQEELPGRNLKIVCRRDRVDAVKELLKGRVRINALVKRDNCLEFYYHYTDLSWSELDKLINSIRDNNDIISIQVFDQRGAL